MGVRIIQYLNTLYVCFILIGKNTANGAANSANRVLCDLRFVSGERYSSQLCLKHFTG